MHDNSLDWDCLLREPNQGLMRWVRDLNHYYRDEPSLHEGDCRPEGLTWIDCNDADSSVLSYSRADKNGHRNVIVVANFTPVPRLNYRIGAELEGYWREILNSDAVIYGGSGWGNQGGVETVPVPMHGRMQSLTLILPPLGMIILRHEGQAA